MRWFRPWRRFDETEGARYQLRDGALASPPQTMLLFSALPVIIIYAVMQKWSM